MSFRRFYLFFVLAGVSLNITGASGTVLGTVPESTGAILPNVKVIVTDTATNAALQTKSDAAATDSAWSAAANA